ncbi:DUF910 family protein [Brevibacillus laterosporus]|uniref:DUF910 family protein n=1 Tax=Brevibacillus laterosporus TaxID=1465 RepID=A0A502IKI0_BRELA|nr:YqgQ family protein [Brevibacillus laterosporus]QDX91169.1 DUF910 family protein [Brevibacillus laterosporus]RAP28104.1 hypothetical protein C2W64_00570 [Brevibacillus laterosporus]TPG69571.1 DUF910 family protein [Brevibacillus laterosporus]TPG86654.1 DUF910 family protein [Brevibacillus laterosporus]
MSDMNTFNLPEFLRRFHIMIYTGDPLGDLLMIEDEVRELLTSKVIDKEEFALAMKEIDKRKRIYAEGIQ